MERSGTARTVALQCCNTVYVRSVVRRHAGPVLPYVADWLVAIR